MDPLQQFKQAAAEAAVALVESGMIVGLGTGSTASLAIDALGKRVKDGLRIVGIPTSEHSSEQARALGIRISSLAEHAELDLTIDGADEIQLGTLDLIKGRGGALLREKVVASSSPQSDHNRRPDQAGGSPGRSLRRSSGSGAVWLASDRAQAAETGRENHIAFGFR